MGSSLWWGGPCVVVGAAECWCTWCFVECNCLWLLDGWKRVRVGMSGASMAVVLGLGLWVDDEESGCVLLGSGRVLCVLRCCWRG